MDLASLETPRENEMMRKLIIQRNLREVWTSGRMCNFRGCDQPHLRPRHVNGEEKEWPGPTGSDPRLLEAGRLEPFP